MERRQQLWAFTILLSASIIVLISMSTGFHESFFLIDDNGLFYQTYLRHPWNLQALKILWTPGYSADYYPLRDMTVWLDWSFAKDLAMDTTVPKIQNYLWLLGITLCLYFILQFFIRNSVLSALCSAAWLLHPFHFESLHWISARKDLMAWFFMLAVSLLWLRMVEKEKSNYGFWICVLFVCGLLSKATFLAMPFAVGAWYLFDKVLFKRKVPTVVIAPLIVTSCLSLVFVGINYWNYTQSNYMQMTEESSVRYISVLAAFGRNILGSLVPFYNAVDVEPWGGWYLYNKSFIPIGAVGIVLLFAGLVYACTKKHRSLLLLIFLIGGVLLMTPGFNPKHRNYYSIRYFEPILFLLWLWGSLWLARMNRACVFAALAVVYFGFSMIAEASNWESNLAITKKSLRISPSDPSLRTMVISEYYNLDAWGRLSALEIEEFKSLFEMLKQDCLVPAEPSARCLSFYPKVNFLYKRFPEASSEIEAQAEEKALKDVLKMKGQIFSEVAKAELAWSRFRYKLNVGEVDQEALRDYFDGHPTLTDDFTRVRYLVLQCLEKGSQESQRLTQQWERDFILDRREVAEFISQIRFPEVRQRMQECFKTPSGS